MSVDSIGWLLNRLHPVIAATTLQVARSLPALQMPQYTAQCWMVSNIIFENASYRSDKRFNSIDYGHFEQNHHLNTFPTKASN
jgi:hypothetical protein